MTPMRSWMRWWILTALAPGLLLGGCGAEGAGAAADAAPAASAEGPLLVAADVGFAPHAMVRADGTAEGFNVDLVAEIARRIGRPGYRVVDLEWSGMFPGLAAQRFEFIAAPVTVTPERGREVLFVEGYIDTDYTFLIKKDAPDITSLEDIRGKTIAVNNGSAYDVWATDNAAKYALVVQRYGKNADAVQAVVTGRAFANLSGETVAKWAAKESPLVRTTYTIKTGSRFSAAFRHADVAFAHRVEDAIECMKIDGTMATLHEKWFGDAPAPGSAAITVDPGYGEPGTVGYDPTPHTPSCG